MSRHARALSSAERASLEGWLAGLESEQPWTRGQALARLSGLAAGGLALGVAIALAQGGVSRADLVVAGAALGLIGGSFAWAFWWRRSAARWRAWQGLIDRPEMVARLRAQLDAPVEVIEADVARAWVCAIFDPEHLRVHVLELAGGGLMVVEAPGGAGEPRARVRLERFGALGCLCAVTYDGAAVPVEQTTIEDVDEDAYRELDRIAELVPGPLAEPTLAIEAALEQAGKAPPR